MSNILRYQINLQDGTFARGMANAQNQTRGLDSMVRRVGTTIAGAFAVGSLAQFSRQAIQTSADLEGLTNSIKFASGSEKEGAKNIQFLSELTNKHGANLQAATKGYKTFLGSMQGANFGMNQIRKMFEQVDVANRVMNLSADDSQGVYLALGQIMSKGKVQAEELRGQIGERIPGAFAIAARSMNVSQAELNKMMDDGKLMAEDFLPRFAAELERTFGSGLEKATSSFQSQSNRRENAILQETAAIGTKLQPAYLTLQDMQLKALQVGSGLINFYSEHNQVINTGVAVLASATAAYTLAAFAKNNLTAATLRHTVVNATSLLGLTAHTYATAAAAAGTGTLTIATRALTVAMMTNPITATLVGIAAIAAGIWAWNASTETQVASEVKLADAVNNTETQMAGKFATLQAMNVHDKKRADLIQEINDKYGAYLPKLLTEKSTLKEIAEAQKAANTELNKGLLLKDMNKELDFYDKRMATIKENLSKNKAELSTLQDSSKGGVFNQNALKISALKDENAKLEKLTVGYGILKDKTNLKKQTKLAEFEATNAGGKLLDTTSTQSVSSSKSIRNVNVSIKSLIENQIVHLAGVKENAGASDIKKIMTDTLLAAIRDFEIAL